MNVTSAPYNKMLAVDDSSRDPPDNNAIYNKIIVDFLSQEPEFVRVSKYRHAGWVTNKEKGDAHFNALKHKADNADSRTRRVFFCIMIEIAKEMHNSTGVFHIDRNYDDINILDICMAPGGFRMAIMDFLPMANYYGLTLSPELGGHEVIVDSSKLRGLLYLDITLLVKEYTDKPVPVNHTQNFDLNITPFSSKKFDIVICDGNILRTHKRPEWREWNERNRLLFSQIILSMQRIRRGGSIIFLLHQIDSWHSILIIFMFSKFSSIYLFKPAKKHSIRSSFYMIAKEINIDSSEAKKSLLEWRHFWWELNFGGHDGTGRNLNPDVEFVKKVLTEFGKDFIEMARPIWKIQADALGKTDFARS